jgi:exodeoxyribonuclease-3
MKIATWNVNSINSRLAQLLEWLVKVKPDLVLLQEIKCTNENFPRDAIEELGYNIVISGQKTFNGVAVLSLYKIGEHHTNFPGNPLPEHARFLEVILSTSKGAMRVISIYVPNGGSDVGDDYRYRVKLEFMEALRAHMKELLMLDEPVIIGGDLNVAPEEIDVHSTKSLEDDVLFTYEVRAQFRAFINLGYYDAYRMLNPNKAQQYTWWDYRNGSWYYNKGMRIDHLLLSPEACDRLKEVSIESDLRGAVKPSDHVPIMCQLTEYADSIPRV